MSVTVCNCLANPHLSRKRALLMPLFFGIFQGLMPLIGYALGSFAIDVIEHYEGLVTLLILGVVGGKMIFDACHEDPESDQSHTTAHLSIATLSLQALATSIDALAVGVSLAASDTNILSASVIIALCTFVCCLAMLFIGRRLGDRFGVHAQIVGGIVLILIGVSAMFH